MAPCAGTETRAAKSKETGITNLTLATQLVIIKFTTFAFPILHLLAVIAELIADKGSVPYEVCQRQMMQVNEYLPEAVSLLQPEPIIQRGAFLRGNQELHGSIGERS